jgi:hypothetical protein
MNRSRATVFWGGGLLLLGILLLLQNLRILPSLVEVIWLAIFAIGGVAFLGVYVGDRQRWWALIPGGALLGIAGIMALEAFFPGRGALASIIFLLALSSTFLAVFVFHRENWWAIIPGGVLLTTAVVALLDQVAPDFEAGAVMMLGLAATFGVLSTLETPQGRLRWPLIPASVLLAVGLLLLASSVGWGMWLVSLLLIVGGAYMVFRSLGRRA